MTFEQLQTFVAVVRTNSFTHAANQLFMSQPAVSQHIQALEREIGQKLFDRAGRRIRLTVAGERFSAFAATVLRESQALQDDLRALDAPLQGTVRIGSINSVGIYTLPSLLADFRQRHPSVQVALRIGTTEPMLDALLAGDLDIAILDTSLQSAESRGIRVSPFPSEELVLAVPYDHPWANRPEISAAELETLPLIKRNRGSRSRSHLDDELLQRGVALERLQIALELDSTEAIKQAICAGLGAGFIPRQTLVRELQWGIVATTQLAGEPIIRPLWLYMPERAQMPERVGLLANFLLEAAPELATPAVT